MIEFELHGVRVNYDKETGMIKYGARAWRVEVAPLHIRIEISKRMARAANHQEASPSRVSKPNRKTNNGIIHSISARGKQKRNNPRT
ncbi:TPA: hypothetical protein ND469_002888 [Klebsiella michiganensis]|nr:hypothetical protein [Klebsiella michiganensis]HCD7472006.1 hypothetical protein [Klebsiella michiganensis]HCD7477719.1 hypothetical protein [Klebsiella michiganensis]